MSDFIAISNDELEKLPTLTPGQLLQCDRCGKRHRIIDGNPPGIIQAVRCQRKTYLVGIQGKRIK